jgi:hypothetical protein
MILATITSIRIAHFFQPPGENLQLVLITLPFTELSYIYSLLLSRVKRKKIDKKDIILAIIFIDRGLEPLLS